MSQHLPTAIIRCFTQPDHGLIELNGPITSQGALDLERALDQQLGYYHFERVVLRISSPGGELDALRYMMDLFDRWSAQERQIHTQVPFSAQSAGALLLSAGKWGYRSVNPHAQLLYHTSRVLSQNGLPHITAGHAQMLAQSMSLADELVLQSLVDRLAKGAGGMNELAAIGHARCLELREKSTAGAVSTIKKWETAFRRMGEKGSPRVFIDALKKRFEEDLSMPAVEAYACCLVDAIG